MVCSRCSLSMAEICSFWEFKELLVLLLYRDRLLVRPPCRTVARLKKSTATTTYRRVGEGPRLPPRWLFGIAQPTSPQFRMWRSPLLRDRPKMLAIRVVDGHALPVFGLWC